MRLLSDVEKSRQRSTYIAIYKACSALRGHAQRRTSAANQSVSFLYRSKHCRKHASWPSVPLPSDVLCSITTPPMPRCAYSSSTHSDLAVGRGLCGGPRQLWIRWQGGHGLQRG